MNTTLVSSEQLRQTAGAFRQASHESLQTLHGLEAAAAHLQDHWAGLPQERFHQDFQEWRRHSRLLARLLAEVAAELEHLAGQYQQADS